MSLPSIKNHIIFKENEAEIRFVGKKKCGKC